MKLSRSKKCIVSPAWHSCYSSPSTVGLEEERGPSQKVQGTQCWTWFVQRQWQIEQEYDDLACQVHDSKLELTRAKKKLTSTKKKIVKQHELTLTHKECMKDKELEKEQIKFEKTKESNLSKLLYQEQNHVNTLTRTEHW
jgi:hypothetical protein